MASFYLPMSLSYASNLAHAPPISGLYSFVFNPIIYAVLGSCPQMVVGPEAAGSLLVGQVIRTTIDKGATGDEDSMMHARVAGIVTSMAGAVIFIAGITRLGFLDSVLSRPFLRGFISAIGFVIFVDQLIPELGLTKKAKRISHGSSLNKLIFLIENIEQAHGLTAGVAFGSFAIIMFCRFGPGISQNSNNVTNIVPQTLEEALAASLSFGSLCTRSLYCGGTVGSVHVEVPLGQKGARYSREHPFGLRFTIYLPLALYTVLYEPHPGGSQHFISHCAPWLLRIFGRCQKPRWWRRQARTRHSWHDPERES